jgi:6-phosphogluconolactonase (cycloisomerase 2 family)
VTSPTISSTGVVGYSQTYSYTIYNISNVAIAVSESISGNSSSVSLATTCTSVPAKGSCAFSVTVIPTTADYNTGNIQDTVTVSFSGRQPNTVTSAFNVSTITIGSSLSAVNITLPSLTSIVVTPSTKTLFGGSTYNYSALGIYGIYSVYITSVATWASSNVSVATIGSSTGVVSAFAVGSSNITATYNAVTSNTATLNVKNYVYFSNSGNDSMSLCSLSNAGVLSGCQTNPTSIPSLSDPLGMAINPTNTYAYLGSNTGDIYVCAIDSSDGSLSGCISTFNHAFPYNIVINASNTYAYIANYTSGLTVCSISSTDGTLSNCQVDNVIAATNSIAVALHPDGLHAYVFKYDVGGPNDLVTCTINTSTGLFYSCTQYNYAANFGTNMVIHPDGTGLYVNDGSAGIYFCPLNAGTKLISSCSSLAVTNVDNPLGIAIKATGDYAYIVNGNYPTQVTTCVVNSNHTLSGCTLSSPAAINAPVAVLAR